MFCGASCQLFCDLPHFGMAPVPDNNPVAETKFEGIDYGIPPRRVLIANPALMELWNNADCYALGYATIPRYESVPAVPMVMVSFENIEAGLRFFRLIRSWDRTPRTGQGIDISFTKNQTTGKYLLSWSTKDSELEKRISDPVAREDYATTIVGLSVGKDFNLSDGFNWIREQSKEKPIVFVPATKDGGLAFQYAIGKRDVRFLEQETAHKDSVERAWPSDQPQPPDSNALQLPSVAPDVIVSKRNRQLRRFFPITLARLPYNRSFIKAVNRMKPSYSDWQLTQAACNIVLVERFSPSDQPKPDFETLYEKMRQKPEGASDTWALKLHFSESRLADQVTRDMEYLSSATHNQFPLENVRASLRKVGLLP
ncbi:MAG: hypothetical protein JWO95_1966 [Verrucomicrobiales bacterium]|nr:hypothetical protein [Verrucomicrobiales bacterium]